MFQSQIGTSPDLFHVTIINLISSLSVPTFFNHFLVLSFLPWDLLLQPLIFHSSMPFHSPCCTRFSSPTCPGTEFLSTCMSLPPVLFHRLSLSLPLLPSLTCSLGPSHPLEFHVACLWILCPSSAYPPFCHSWPAHRYLSDPRVFSLLRSLPISAFLCLPLVRSSPWWPWPAAHFLAFSEEFLLCSLYPCHFCTRVVVLVAYLPLGVFWLLFYLLGFILHWSKRSGSLHSLPIDHPGPRPCATCQWRRCSDYPEPPSLSLPLVLVIPSLLVEVVSQNAIS